MFFDAWDDRYSELRDHAIIGPIYRRGYEAYDALKRQHHDYTTASRLAREQAVAEILALPNSS